MYSPPTAQSPGAEQEITPGLSVALDVVHNENKDVLLLVDLNMPGPNDPPIITGPILASQPDSQGAINLYIGSDAGLRQQVDKTDGDETIYINHVEPAPGSPPSPGETVEISMLRHYVVLGTTFDYWVTQTIGSSGRSYYESAHAVPLIKPGERVEVPSAVAHATLDAPLPRDWAERNVNLKHFSEINAGLTAVGGGTAVWGDYDNDGRLDILLTGYNLALTPVTYVYHNEGNGAFCDTFLNITGVAFSTSMLTVLLDVV